MIFLYVLLLFDFMICRYWLKRNSHTNTRYSSTTSRFDL